jgi:Holliday junction resolvase RusA-like endonuclease
MKDNNEEHHKTKTKTKIYNLSIKDICDNLSKTVIDMLNEFSIYRHDENKRWNDYVRIITQEDRLIYVGIIFVIVSLIVFFIDISR